MLRNVLVGLSLVATVFGLGGCPSQPSDNTGPDSVTPNASGPTTANKGETVALTASLQEADVDTTRLNYQWFQEYGYTVDLSGSATPNVSFVAPSLPNDQTMRFRVDVEAGGGVFSDSVSVRIVGDPNYVDPDDNGSDDSPIALMRAEYDKTPGQLAEVFASMVEEGKDANGNTLRETDSGLQYVEIVAGTGDRPDEDNDDADTVRVQYIGWLYDNGSMFDSSLNGGTPAEFALSGVIDGWTEGLQLMRVGSYYRFVIPADLAYGEDGNGSIPGDATLVFDVYLIAIVN